MKDTANAVSMPPNAKIEPMIEAIFQKEFKGMKRFAQSLLQDESLSEVAVQETFLLAVKKFDAFSASPAPVGWLYNTLRYVVLAIQRDQKKLAKIIDTSLECVEAVKVSTLDSYPGLSLTASKDPDIRLLVKVYVECYTIREMADSMHISEGACKMRLKRAKKRLREILKENEE